MNVRKIAESALECQMQSHTLQYPVFPWTQVAQASFPGNLLRLLRVNMCMKLDVQIPFHKHLAQSNQTVFWSFV